MKLRDFALKCLESNEELFRIYCYHCPPYDGVQTHPLSKAKEDFSQTDVYLGMSNLIRDLKVTDNIAFRSGELSFDGWLIRRRAAQDIIKTGRALTDSDFAPDLKQKRVDMKIGLDVAWLASKAIVEKLVLVTADSDFVTVMKFARREGVQVVLVTMGHKLVKQDLKEHADELRTVTYP